MFRILKWFLLFLVVAVLAAAATGWWYLDKRPLTLSDHRTEAVVRFSEGETLRSLIDDVIAEGYDLNAQAAALAFRYLKADRGIRAGKYQIKSGWTLRALIEHFKSGKILMSRMTFVEGQTTAQFVAKAQASDELDHPQGLLSAKDAALAAGVAPDVHPEGMLAADTFIFANGTDDTVLFSRMRAEQEKRLKQAWEGRDPTIAVKTPYELLILASLIEKETGAPEDRALVSSVFNNRLKKGMLLQTDPTVVYGIEDFDGRILRSHLKADHPYNTYIHAGLPPTPICSPSKASLEAAAHPAKTDYLYFVASGQGRSYFSKTLREHNDAVRRFLRRPRQ